MHYNILYLHYVIMVIQAEICCIKYVSDNYKQWVVINSVSIIPVLCHNRKNNSKFMLVTTL